MMQAEVAYRENVEETQERDQLILKELPQVYYIARRISERLPQHVSFEDLVHAGVVGLIEAVRSYDVRKAVPFNAFAKFRIRGAMLDSLRQLDWASRPLRRKERQIEEAISRLWAKLGRQPEEDEIAAEMGISIDKLHEVALRLDGLKLAGQEMSLASDPSQKRDLIESAPSRDENAYDLHLRSEIQGQLAEAIGTLSQKEQLIISLYYKEELTMKEIAKIVHLAESRVSQIHALVLPKLRAALERNAGGREMGNGSRPLPAQEGLG